MPILFLTQVLPYPLDAGPKTRAYYTLRQLAQRHAVTLVSFVRPTDSADAVRHLGQFCRAVHTVPMPRSPVRNLVQLLASLWRRESFIILRDQVDAMTHTIQRCLAAQDFAAIHADQLWMASYALAARPLANAAERPSLVLDQHNAAFRIPQRLAAAEPNPLKRALLHLEASKLAAYEAATCQQFDRVVWVTRSDHAAVQAQAGTGSAIPNSAVIPICGDPVATPPVVRSPNTRRVVLLGGFNYLPNAQAALWFAEQVFPQVLQQVPDAVFTVIGRDPPRQHLQAALPAPALDITGYVADLQPYLAETAVFVVPLLAGGGMRVKIIDAWLWGLPVVSTPLGIEGIEHTPDENIVIADGPAAFAQATVALLQDPAMQNRLAMAGRQWVTTRYDWRTRYGVWDEIYAGLMPVLRSSESSHSTATQTDRVRPATVSGGTLT